MRIPVGGDFTLEARRSSSPARRPRSCATRIRRSAGAWTTRSWSRSPTPAPAPACRSCASTFAALGGSGGTPTGGLDEHEDVAAAVAWARAQGAPRVARRRLLVRRAHVRARRSPTAPSVAAFAAVGFPTTIMGHAPDRVAIVERALDRRIPWLFVEGDTDQFCEIDRLRAWADGRAWVRHEVLPGRRSLPDRRRRSRPLRAASPASSKEATCAR